MILILSSSDDQSTLEVIQWLNFYRLAWVKIDSSTPLKLIELVLNDKTEEFILETASGLQIDTREIKAYWYRRGHLKLDVQLTLNSSLSDETIRQFEDHMQSELAVLVDALHCCLAQKKQLNSFKTADLNKHFVLSQAKFAGLKIPATLVTSQKVAFKNFESENGALISKAIQHGIRFRLYKEKSWVEYMTYTESFHGSIVPAHFFPTLFQTKLNKAYELRIFYLYGDFYTMAIFSQKDEKTAVDFRNYNFEKPNRTIPYLLPDHLKHKLNVLMKLLQLESGSIDMVVTTENEFIFLEVNPVGQYGMVSIPCNYHLNQKIAHYLHSSP